MGSGVGPVIVVLGANAGEIRSCLEGLDVHVVVNTNWEEGMGSSLRAGMEALGVILPVAKSVIVALADQPGFSRRHLSALLEAQRKTGRSIVASRSGEKFLPPVFFAAVHFPELRILRGDSGARTVLQRYAPELAVVEVSDPGDLDTPADYEDFLRRHASAPEGDAGKSPSV